MGNLEPNSKKGVAVSINGLCEFVIFNQLLNNLSLKETAVLLSECGSAFHIFYGMPIVHDISAALSIM